MIEKYTNRGIIWLDHFGRKFVPIYRHGFYAPLLVLMYPLVGLLAPVLLAVLVFEGLMAMPDLSWRVPALPSNRTGVLLLIGSLALFYCAGIFAVNLVYWLRQHTAYRKVTKHFERAP